MVTSVCFYEAQWLSFNWFVHLEFQAREGVDAFSNRDKLQWIQKCCQCCQAGGFGVFENSAPVKGLKLCLVETWNARICCPSGRCKMSKPSGCLTTWHCAISHISSNPDIPTQNVQLISTKETARTVSSVGRLFPLWWGMCEDSSNSIKQNHNP